jgi:hypothetical protein
MNKALLPAILALTLAACWNATSTGNDAGTSSTGTGGEGGSACATCGAVLRGDEPQTSLCSASAGLYANIQGCACEVGATCYDACSGNFCAGIPDATCTSCLQTQCASTYATCANDKSTQ